MPRLGDARHALVQPVVPAAVRCWYSAILSKPRRRVLSLSRGHAPCILPARASSIGMRRHAGNPYPENAVCTAADNKTRGRETF
jgi:hypothetical protein